MIPSARYVLAFVVNVALPTAAYWLAYPHVGLRGALAVSALPLLAWMAIDFIRYRHFDALSALLLASIAMSLLILVSGYGHRLRDARDPFVNGIIGVLFLASLALDRPLMFYLARSTMSRERQGQELEFDDNWLTQPELVRSIRMMTAVWGIALICENLGRLWIVETHDFHTGERMSMIVRYVTYGALTAWTIFYRRRYLKQHMA